MLMNRKTKMEFIRRYFLGCKENKFIRNLIDDEELDNELLWGYFSLFNRNNIWNSFEF